MENRKLCFEAQFNGNPNYICRTLAHTEKEAREIFKKVYPKDKITKIYEP